MFEAARFFHKSFFVDKTLKPIFERESDPGLKKLSLDEKRLLYATFRHAWPISLYLDTVYPKWRKKKNSLLGMSFLFLALEEQIFGQKALYYTYGWLNKGLSGARTEWLKPIARAILDRVPKGVQDFYSAIENRVLVEPYISRIISAFPDFCWQELFSHPPLWARVKSLDIIQSLHQDDVIQSVGQAIQLKKTSALTTELFENGLISFQNISSQTLCSIFDQLDLKPQSLIETCAAPGGKSLLLLERYLQKNPKIPVLLTDLYSDKVLTLEKNIDRIYPESKKLFPSLSMEVHDWEKMGVEKKADLILVDAPCSGSGVTRKHPDALWRSAEELAPSLIQAQKKILINALSCLNPGGVCIYTTCSLDPQENDGVISHVLRANEGIVSIPCEIAEGSKSDFGHQILPNASYDGLYIAILRKQP